MSPEQSMCLLEWYGSSARELPWRSSREAYPVLVSELMLQQTTVAAVLPLYRRWMSRFPTLDSLASAAPDQVMEAWSGLGYYHRARRLHAAAKILRERGVLPSSLQEWLCLPGLGPYTAAAVAAIAGGLPHLALDTNALRVLLRFYGWEVRADRLAVHAALRERVESSLSGDVDFGLLNQALMELGATLCRPRSPHCAACPLVSACQAHGAARQGHIPLPKPKKSLESTETAVYLIPSSEGLAVWTVRGTATRLLPDLFQPPIDFFEGNDPRSPLTPFLEQLRARASQQPTEMSTAYGISGRRLHLAIKTVSVEAGEVQEQAAALGLDARSWRTGDSLAVSSLTRKILKVWEESRRDPQPPDEKCRGCEIAPPLDYPG